jgi:hypothetical protein
VRKVKQVAPRWIPSSSLINATLSHILSIPQSRLEITSMSINLVLVAFRACSMGFMPPPLIGLPSRVSTQMIQTRRRPPVLTTERSTSPSSLRLLSRLKLKLGRGASASVPNPTTLNAIADIEEEGNLKAVPLDTDGGSHQEHRLGRAASCGAPCGAHLASARGAAVKRLYSESGSVSHTMYVK